MTPSAPPGVPTTPAGPAPVALAVALDLVTKYHLRLTEVGDSRLGELAGKYTLGAVSWTGRRAAFVGFYDPPDDPAEAARDLGARCETARRWGRERLVTQRAEVCDLLLIALSPVAGDQISGGDEGTVRLGVVHLDVTRGAAEAVIQIPSGMPSLRELRNHARSVRGGGQVPTLAAVDLAERQTTAGGYAQPTRQALVTQPIVTYTLIGIFFAIFIAEKALIRINPLTGTSISLADFGALYHHLAFFRPEHAEWWRYVSSAFLHDDTYIFHVFGNSLAMFFIGRLVEQLYGKLILIGVFLITAVAGGLVWVAAGSTGVIGGGISIGASGGIAGLMGLLIMLGRVQGRDVPVGVAMSIRQYVATYVVLTALFGFFLSRVNNFAHAGGFAAGVLLSLVLAPMAGVGGRPRRRYEEAALVAVIAASVVALGFASYHLANALNQPAVLQL